MKIYISFLILIGLFSLTSCEDDFTPDKTATSEFAGEWFVSLYQEVDGSYEDVLGGYFHLLTSNTASNSPDSIWIIDTDEVLPLKVKIGANTGDLSFSGSAVDQFEGEESVTISNGSILMEQAISTGGNQTDSIFFDIEFASEPGVTYTVAGYRRTGFPADEH